MSWQDVEECVMKGDYEQAGIEIGFMLKRLDPQLGAVESGVSDLCDALAEEVYG